MRYFEVRLVDRALSGDSGNEGYWLNGWPGSLETRSLILRRIRRIDKDI